MTLLEIMYEFCDSGGCSDSRLENRNYSGNMSTYMVWGRCMYVEMKCMGEMQYSLTLKLITEFTMQTYFPHYTNI